ncbi:hypothetical protein GGX14DRAFT_384237 [Mycena pura]|uniref:Uncharacterized protein n=1 Tax=Mycena pura TaxID=153505 RepID=A0AAD7E5M8_9AGAR|nr:hypothetical protein GGX14DRAFT_384237 [Mycena pura]
MRERLERALTEAPRGWVVDGNYTRRVEPTVDSMTARLTQSVHLRRVHLRRPFRPAYVADDACVPWLDPSLVLYLLRLILRMLGLQEPCSPGCSVIGGWGIELHAWLDDVERMLQHHHLLRERSRFLWVRRENREDGGKWGSGECCCVRAISSFLDPSFTRLSSKFMPSVNISMQQNVVPLEILQHRRHPTSRGYSSGGNSSVYARALEAALTAGDLSHHRHARSTLLDLRAWHASDEEVQQKGARGRWKCASAWTLDESGSSTRQSSSSFDSNSTLPSEIVVVRLAGREACKRCSRVASTSEFAAVLDCEEDRVRVPIELEPIDLTVLVPAPKADEYVKQGLEELILCREGILLLKIEDALHCVSGVRKILRTNLDSDECLYAT